MTEAPLDGASGKKRVVVISGYHDYRTSKRASIHQIADGLVRDGFDVSFISTRFSSLSRRTDDSRLFLWDRANQLEVVNEVRCFLWRTSLHPFRSGFGPADALLGKLFTGYANLPNATFDRLVSEADYLILEAGVPGIYLRRLRRLNQHAKIICYCTDRPDTVGSHPVVRQKLIEDQQLVDHFILRSPAMADYFDFAPGRLYQVGFGIHQEELATIGQTPYPAASQNAVSVGSMLFDKTFFDIAAPAFPDLQFHVIGSGADLEVGSNLKAYSEMPFAKTLPFVKHASIGIAPYRPAPAAEYLADSSLKLAQFEFFGIPAVCPHFAVGTARSRVGYQPGDEQSIKEAVAAAMALVGTIKPRSFPDWSEVALRVLEPTSYADAALS